MNPVGGFYCGYNLTQHNSAHQWTILSVLVIHTTRFLRTRFPWLLEPTADPRERDARRGGWTGITPNPLAAVERFRQQVPGARILIVEGHHYVHNSDLERVVSEIHAFLERSVCAVRMPPGDRRTGEPHAVVGTRVATVPGTTIVLHTPATLRYS